MVRASRIHHPKVGVALVRHRIGELAYVDDPFTIRRYLRIDRELNLEFVIDGQFIEGILGEQPRRADREQRCGPNGNVPGKAAHTFRLLGFYESEAVGAPILASRVLRQVLS